MAVYGVGMTGTVTPRARFSGEGYDSYGRTCEGLWWAAAAPTLSGASKAESFFQLLSFCRRRQSRAEPASVPPTALQRASARAIRNVRLHIVRGRGGGVFPGDVTGKGVGPEDGRVAVAASKCVSK